MLPSDLDLACLCASSESSAPAGFDFIDDGAETGIWVGIRSLPDVDVVVFRGSITPEDWWRDAHAEMIALPHVGLVHAGFAENIIDVKAKLTQKVRKNYVVTGHSLGAARAAIFSALQIFSPLSITLFGCPRPGSDDLRVALENIKINSYKNRQDPITDVPLSLPDLPYVHVRSFIAIDGMVDTTLGVPWDDHHISNYVKGLENDQSNTSQ